MGKPAFSIVANQSFFDHYYLTKDEPVSDPAEEDIRHDFNRFLRQGSTYAQYLTDFLSHEAFTEAVLGNPVLEQIINYNPSVLYNQFHGTISSKDSLITDKRELLMFMLEEHPEAVLTSIKQAGHPIITAKSLTEDWKPYDSGQSNSVVTISNNPTSSQAFQWQQLQKFQFPFHSMVLFDPYIFTVPVEKNLKPLLKHLITSSAEIPSNPEILIIFQKIPDPSTRDGTRNATLHTDSAQLITWQEDLEKYLRKKLGISSPKVRLVIYNNSSFSRANHGERHIDRWVITNQLYIKASHGFTIFDSSQKIGKTSDLSFHFVNHYQHAAHVQKLRISVSRYLKTLGEPEMTLLE